MTKLAIFASGRGTNAEAIIRFFKEHKEVKVALIASNNATSGVVEIAKRAGIPTAIISKENFYNTEEILTTLKKHQINFIALAGFLWLVPQYLIESFPRRIINIHPALLPKFGGKGMYGAKVHEAVLNSGEKESGITIHYVDERYDKGDVIFQKKCSVEKNETAESLSKKVQELEHRYYPLVIEKLLIKETASL